MKTSKGKDQKTSQGGRGLHKNGWLQEGGKVHSFVLFLGAA